MTRSRALRSTAILLATIFALAACAPARATAPGSSDGAGVIGVSLPATADAVWARGGDALDRELTARGYRVDLQFAASDARTQAAQVQNMLTKGADAVIVAPVASGDLSVPLAAAEGEGVPVVGFGRSLAGVDVRGGVAFDAAELGRAQAEALLADLSQASASGESGAEESGSEEPGAGETSSPAPSTPGQDASPSPSPAARLVVLAVGESDAWEADRYDAALAALQPAVADGRIEIVSGATRETAAVGGDTARAQATAAEERVRRLRAGAAADAPTAILALGDAVTRGVVTALTTAAPETDAETASPTPSPEATEEADAAPAPAPLVVGSGADPETVRALRDGAVDATAFADPRTLVPDAADLVEALLDDRDAPDDGGIGAGPSIVRADDVEELIASGWISADEL